MKPYGEVREFILPQGCSCTIRSTPDIARCLSKEEPWGTKVYKTLSTEITCDVDIIIDEGIVESLDACYMNRNVVRLRFPGSSANVEVEGMFHTCKREVQTNGLVRVTGHIWMETQ